MSSAHAAVPRWAADPPDVDGSGREYGIVGPDCALTRRWAEQVTALGRPCWRVGAAGLEGALAQATVGLRVLVTGPEAEVLDVAARCRAAGLGSSELTLHALAAEHRRVYCAHCTTTSLVAAQVEEVAPCDGCGRGLLIFAHLSARTGSYLGFQADAEDVA